MFEHLLALSDNPNTGSVSPIQTVLFWPSCLNSLNDYAAIFMNPSFELCLNRVKCNLMLQENSCSNLKNVDFVVTLVERKYGSNQKAMDLTSFQRNVDDWILVSSKIQTPLLRRRIPVLINFVSIFIYVFEGRLHSVRRCCGAGCGATWAVVLLSLKLYSNGVVQFELFEPFGHPAVKSVHILLSVWTGVRTPFSWMPVKTPILTFIPLLAGYPYGK